MSGVIINLIIGIVCVFVVMRATNVIQLAIHNLHEREMARLNQNHERETAKQQDAFQLALAKGDEPPKAVAPAPSPSARTLTTNEVRAIARELGEMGLRPPPRDSNRNLSIEERRLVDRFRSLSPQNQMRVMRYQEHRERSDLVPDRLPHLD